VSREFCSELAIAGLEPLVGSAIVAQRPLFITWPKRLWTYREFESAEFPTDLAQYVKVAQRASGVMPHLAYRPDDPADTHSVLLMSERLFVAGVARADLLLVTRALVEREPLPQRYKCQSLTLPSLFVCTHGQRDRCCAKFGYGVFAEASRERDRRGLKLDLWECTHLGGDRFAANVFAFPSFHMYGHVRTEHVAALLDHVQAGTVYAPLYRGSMKLSGHLQLAEAVAQKYCFEHRIAPEIQIIVLEDVPDVSACVRVSIRGSGRPVEIHLWCIRKQYVAVIDCDELDERKQRTVTRWVVDKDSVTEA
jgi:hypothetical protein